MLVSPSQLQASPQTGHARIDHLKVVAGQQARTAVLLNANAKKVNRRVKERFEQAVPADDLFFSTSLAQARQHARTIIDRRYGTVLAGGGDGTIVNAMNMLLRAADDASAGLYRPPLPDIGILRLGTGNGLGHMTKAGRPMDDTLRILAGDRPRARPMQLMEDRDGGDVFPFGSLGYDAQLLNDYQAVAGDASSPMASAVMKSVAGYFYALGTRTIPQQLSAANPRVRVVANGRCSRIDPETDEEIPLPSGALLFDGIARTVAMGTTPFYGYGMRVFPFADRRSDRFHLRISTASIPFVLSRLPKVWDGSLRTEHFFDFLVEGVRIESDVDLPYQTAGDAKGYRRELEVNLSPRTFRVLDMAAS